MVRTLALWVVCLLSIPTSGQDLRETASDGPHAPWVWPVDSVVVDHFRPPRSAWGAGNRGWEFSTGRGDVVVAVGGGTVAWAGSVAGRGVVTIDHGGSLVSSVTGLLTVEVRAGEAVAPGTRIGLAMPSLHLGFRLGGNYVDPALYLQRPVHAVLVPVPR